MGIFGAFKKKDKTPEGVVAGIDVPPSPAEVDAPPKPEDIGLPEGDVKVDEPPKPEDIGVDEEGPKEADEPPEAVAPAKEEELRPLDQLEGEEEGAVENEETALEAIEKKPEEDVEMPEEIKPKPKSDKQIDDEQFKKRLKKIQDKVNKKDRGAVVEAELERMKSENDYLKARLEKLTSILESLPISELDTRIEGVNKDNRDNKAKLSDVFDKLSLHSNLINETMSVRDEFTKLQDSNGEVKKQLEMISDSLDSYKNTLYMLNKKVELVDGSKRIDKVESKIKEIIVYLNKITRIITKE